MIQEILIILIIVVYLTSIILAIAIIKYTLFIFLVKKNRDAYNDYYRGIVTGIYGGLLGVIITKIFDYQDKHGLLSIDGFEYALEAIIAFCIILVIGAIIYIKHDNHIRHI